jgi:hypothetical protein
MIERLRGQTSRRYQRDINIAVAPTETGMGQAANEVRAQHLGPERFLPIPDQTAGEIDGRGSGVVIKVGLRDR